MPFVKPGIDWGGRRGGGLDGVGCPVWNKHECSLSSLRHRTSLPTFTAALEKREEEEEERSSGWGTAGARVAEEEVGFTRGGEREAKGWVGLASIQ